MSGFTDVGTCKWCGRSTKGVEVHGHPSLPSATVHMCRRCDRGRCPRCHLPAMGRDIVCRNSSCGQFLQFTAKDAQRLKDDLERWT